MTDPFDVMRSTGALAPGDPRLNDIRWLIGEALRRLHARAQLDAREAAKCQGLNATLSEIALHARDKIRAAEEKVGPAAWPIVIRVVLNGHRVCDCRGYVPEIKSPWCADAVITDRLRVALDQLGDMLGVTSPHKS